MLGKEKFILQLSRYINLVTACVKIIYFVITFVLICNLSLFISRQGQDTIGKKTLKKLTYLAVKRVLTSKYRRKASRAGTKNNT